MVDRAADRSVARQVADALRAEITDGTLGAGMPLPSEVALTQRFGVARATVRVAVGILRAEGKVTTYPGRGTFVRQAGELRRVPVTAGAVVTARVPTDVERRALDLAEGVPLLVVSRDGADDEVFAADRTALEVAGG